MAEIVNMPRLSDTMEEGVLVKWLKKESDKVSSGDIIAEIETDKATMEFESFYDGVMLHLGVKEGETIPVDHLIAIIGKKGEDISAILASKQSLKAEKKPPVLEKEKSPPIAQDEKEQAVKKEAENTAGLKPIKISPLAKKLAHKHHIDIHQIKGSAPNGRIIKKDIDPLIAQGESAGFPAFVQQEKYEDAPITQMRKSIAKSLSNSKFSAPHFYLKMIIDAEKLIQDRKAINEQLGVKITFNDLMIKAVALSLKAHPKINSSWLEDKIRTYHHVHIGVAIAIDQGLVVPVIPFADGKALKQLSAEVKEKVKKAQGQKLTLDEMKGSTFTISNLGMMGIEEFTAIINPPNACILAVGAILPTPMVKDQKIVPGNTMKLTLSCDHRVVDGASGALFLNTLKSFLENPIKMFCG